MKRLKISWNDPYDWEIKEKVEELIKRRKTKADYEEAKSFFDSDPLKINIPSLSEGKNRSRTLVSKMSTSQDN